MVKVSIVIPVYNRKNFLTVCIKSLLAQSFEDFEICLVDDGSRIFPGGRLLRYLSDHSAKPYEKYIFKESFHYEEHQKVLVPDAGAGTFASAIRGVAQPG